MGWKMDLGTELRQARERRGMSLAVLAASTKIGLATLQAMERGDFSRLPGGLFTRGFLRAYAREVGLDPEETVRHYLAEFEVAPPVEAALQGGDDEHRDPTAEEIEHLHRRNRRKQLVGGVAVVLMAALLYFTFLGRHSGGGASVAAQSPPPEPVSQQKAEVGTTGTADATRPAATPTDRWAGRLHLELQPQAPCWVSAITDGRQGLQRLINPGEREAIDATDEVTLRLGDPSACAFSINGLAARPVGQPGQPATLRITRQNYKDFVNSALLPAATITPPVAAAAPTVGASRPAAPAARTPAAAPRTAPSADPAAVVAPPKPSVPAAPARTAPPAPAAPAADDVRTPDPDPGSPTEPVSPPPQR
jgi:cytoskeleton protein RodZ